MTDEGYELCHEGYELYSQHCTELVCSNCRARNNFRIVSGHDDRPNSFFARSRIVSGRSNVYDEFLF